jgi:hypothetical protein
MIIVAQILDVTLFLNHHVMTVTNVLMITVMKQPAPVSSNQLTATIMTNVLMMNVYLNLVAVIGHMVAMITTLVLVTLVILQLVVYSKIFLTNVKLTTNVTKIDAAQLLDVLMI